MPKMSYEGKTYYGVAGSTAPTLITNIRDENYDFDSDDGDTTIKGDGSAPPIETSQVTVRKVSMGWNMTNDTADTTLAALLAAAYAGNPVALRIKDYSAGKGYDGDVILKVKRGSPLKGEQTFDFTAKPTRQSGRDPQLYV